MTENELFLLVRSALLTVVSDTIDEKHIIRAFQNAPMPVGAYFAIYVESFLKEGFTSHETTTLDVSAGKADIDAYKPKVNIYAVNMDSELLLEFMEWAKTEDGIEFFVNSGASILSFTGPTKIPSLSDQTWIEENLLILNMSMMRTKIIADGDYETIEEVQITGDAESHEINIDETSGN